MVDKDQVKGSNDSVQYFDDRAQEAESNYQEIVITPTKTEDSTALTKRLEGKGIKFEYKSRRMLSENLLQ